MDILQDIAKYFQKRADETNNDRERTAFAHAALWVRQWRKGLRDKVRDVALDPILALDEVESPMQCGRNVGGCGGCTFSVFKGARYQPFVVLQCTECGAVYAISSLNMKDPV